MSQKTTEQASRYDHLEKMSTRQLLTNINQEDQTVPLAVAKVIPQVEKLVDRVYEQMREGGRLFYLGSGTSGRLGIVDASECPPTYGVPHNWVIGLIAGGKGAILKAVEYAEDSLEAGWEDLLAYRADKGDFVLGISASGTTPYVLGALRAARGHGIPTGSIACNLDSPISLHADYPIEVVVGPEFVTGSTRMKAGTAQKLILNMISTSVMIRLGRVSGNKMVDMQLTNNKLVDRGVRMILEEHDIEYEAAKGILLQHGNVRDALASLS